MSIDWMSSLIRIRRTEWRARSARIWIPPPPPPPSLTSSNTQTHTLKKTLHSAIHRDPATGGFSIDIDDKAKATSDPLPLPCACVMLATGSSREGHALAQALGHTIIPPVPSLFTLELSAAGKSSSTKSAASSSSSTEFIRLPLLSSLSPSTSTSPRNMVAHLRRAPSKRTGS